MKKQIILYIVTSYIMIANAIAQVGQWAWIHGNNAPGGMGNHGTLGVPNPSNDPAAMYEVAEWTDTLGNFWLYGGLDSSSNVHNDLWKYDPASNQWTWINGTNTINDAGNYGAQGIPSASNRPPAKAWGATSWVDHSGNLWLFGGADTNGGCNDLWKYDISINQWTWMKGSNVPGADGVYGTKGVANAANTPASRYECSASWTDNNGDLWLFGGLYDGGEMNDLWRYSIASNEWTWMKGSSFNGEPGVYGTQGVEDPANTPGARDAYCHWLDKQGNFWLFGGATFSNAHTISENDLWKYNPTTGNWVWINGSDTAGQDGVYGTKCIASSNIFPGQRYENRTSWTDQNGNLWLFGGGVGGGFQKVLNDLWMYCIQANQWIWVAGDSIYNPIGIWGTMGVPNAANKPCGRGGSVGWTDHDGHLYTFGGSGAFLTPYNDLWMFTIDSTCGICSVIAPVVSFQSSDSTLCAFDCINFTDESTNATSWSWSFSGGTPSSSTVENPQNICYLTSGSYDVTLIASNGGGSDSVTFTNYINVIGAPPTPTITQRNDTLFCSTNPSYTSYQWFDDSTLITGATDTFLIVSKGGNYNVEVNNEFGCKIAVGINIILGIQNYSNDIHLILSPNPATDQLLISGNWKSGEGKLTIFNVLGEIIYTKEINSKQETVNPPKDGSAVVDCKLFPSGIYFVQVANATERWVGRFVKE